MKAPLIIFGFNRPDALKRLVDSVYTNPEISDTDLFVFIDGARPNKEGEQEKVEAVCKVAQEIEGFKSKQIVRSPKNKGLASSIISGVTEVMNKYGRAIILEDDLIVMPTFLSYMNQMLDKYENDKKVFQVSGFGIKINKVPKDYKADTYFHYRGQCWSWGTWKDRWDTVDWEVKTYQKLCADKKLQKAFNHAGSDMFSMLKSYMEGRSNSWFIRFSYEMHLQNKLVILPIRSLVINEGFGSDATHCKGYDRYKTNPNPDTEHVYKYPEKIEADERICRQAVFFWSIPYRIYGKIMQYTYKLLGK